MVVQRIPTVCAEHERSSGKLANASYWRSVQAGCYALCGASSGRASGPAKKALKVAEALVHLLADSTHAAHPRGARVAVAAAAADDSVYGGAAAAAAAAAASASSIDAAVVEPLRRTTRSAASAAAAAAVVVGDAREVHEGSGEQKSGVKRRASPAHRGSKRLRAGDA